MPKSVWRPPSTRRTLEPLTVESLVRRALQGWAANDSAAPAIIEADVSQGGTEVATRVPRSAKIRDWTGLFTLSRVGEDVKVSLSQEACRREVYTPRRSSQHLVHLHPWEPVRVILNGKADWPSGRYYYVQDYHLILCKGGIPLRLQPVRTLDFQADLI